MATDVSAGMQSDQTVARDRAPRYLFIARFRATDAVSGMQIEGLTTDLSEGGCCLLTRRGPFSVGTVIRLEITKNGVTLAADATVVYNLRDQIVGVCFAEMKAEQAAVHAGWIKAARLAAGSR